MRVRRLWYAALALSLVHESARAQEVPTMSAIPSPEVSASSDPMAPSCRCSEEEWVPFWQRWRLGKKKEKGAPREAYAAPLGESRTANARAMILNGVAARMTLYQYDFVHNSDQLSPRGRDQLARIVGMLADYPFPLVIERSPCVPSLDEARRATVLNELARSPIAIPPERVVIGIPGANGLSGTEAVLQYRRLLQQTISGGTATAVLGSGTPGGGSGFVATPPGGAISTTAGQP